MSKSNGEELDNVFTIDSCELPKYLDTARNEGALYHRRRSPEIRNGLATIKHFCPDSIMHHPKLSISNFFFLRRVSTIEFVYDLSCFLDSMFFKQPALKEVVRRSTLLNDDSYNLRGCRVRS